MALSSGLVLREIIIGLNDDKKDLSYKQRKPSSLQRITRTNDHGQYRVPFLNMSGMNSMELFQYSPSLGAENNPQQTSGVPSSPNKL